MAVVSKGRPKKDGPRTQDSYRLNGSAPETSLYCKTCKKTSPIKCNEAVTREIRRIGSYLRAPEQTAPPACPHDDCENADKPVDRHRSAYASQGRRGRSRRYLCKSCRRTFSVQDPGSRFRQKKPHLNKTVFSELVTKKSVYGICEVTELAPQAVYDKIDFIYRQCVGFAGERERQLPKMERKWSRLAVDRQDYMVNWRSRRIRKTIQLTGICTVDQGSGYVLGHHLNYDPHADPAMIEEIADLKGENGIAQNRYWRTHPEYWLEDEFRRFARLGEYAVRPTFDSEPLAVDRAIRAKAKFERKLPEPEMGDAPGSETQLPRVGVMTHLDYTAYAHARLIRMLLHRTKYLTIYTDQDEVTRGAFISAFAPKIAMGYCDMAYVQFTKELDIDEKRRLRNIALGQTRAGAAAAQMEVPDFVRAQMSGDYRFQASREKDWRKRWVKHPLSTINEPERQVLYLSDNGDKDDDEIGWVLSQASLAPVDNYFMRLRRKVQYFERAVPTRANKNALWAGYHPYDPIRVVQMLEIFRVYTNYIWTPRGKGKKTPAMKFGLAKGRLSFEDIIYWTPNSR